MPSHHRDRHRSVVCTRPCTCVRVQNNRKQPDSLILLITGSRHGFLRACMHQSRTPNAYTSIASEAYATPCLQQSEGIPFRSVASHGQHATLSLPHRENKNHWSKLHPPQQFQTNKKTHRASSSSGASKPCEPIPAVMSSSALCRAFASSWRATPKSQSCVRRAGQGRGGG